MVILDPGWNPSHDLQAQDRAFRLGARRDVDVFRLVAAGTLEEVVYGRQVGGWGWGGCGWPAGWGGGGGVRQAGGECVCVGGGGSWACNICYVPAPALRLLAQGSWCTAVMWVGRGGGLACKSCHGPAMHVLACSECI